MANKNIIPIFIVILSGLSVVIVLPNILISSNLSSYGTIYKTESYPFPEYLSPNVELNIIADVGKIKIEYVDPSPNTYGKIDVTFKMRGSDLAGKSYRDYFSLNWQTTNSSVNFTLKLLSESWFDASLWSMKNVSIIISLRKDIMFDIMATIDEGDFELSVPFYVSIGNIHTNVSTGDVFYDFQYCTIEGNITGITNEGVLELKSYNVQYTQNCNWLLKGSDMGVKISQHKEMGANITGTAFITTGVLMLFYNDTTADIGAYFFFPLESGSMIPPQEGFNLSYQGLKTWLISSDFPTINNYNLTFYLTGQHPYFSVDLHSD